MDAATTSELDRIRAALSDRYAFERPIGAGGMATVYLAADLKHGRQVAVKVLHPDVASAVGGERFLAEIRVTAALQHPNILPLYDSGEANGLLYYVMPHVQGKSLRDRLNREKQLPIDQAIEITRAVASALEYAHGRGVIHRDIKPENILLEQGQALVADFGIALAVTAAGGSRLTEAGISLGTPQYMCPEQALGDPNLDARADVYALGATLYEMLAGRPPFSAVTGQGLIAKVISEPVPALKPDRPTVPTHVEAAILVALEKLPADRFSSARAFADALVNTSFAGLRTGTRSGARTARQPSLKERAAIPAALLAVAAIGVAAWALLQAPEVQPAQVLRYRLSLPPQQLLTTRYSSRVAISPDGSRLVYMGPSPQGIQLWTRLRDRLDATPIPGTEGAAAPFFSPDGRQVGFLNVGRRAIQVVTLEGGAVSTVVPSDVRLVGASWGRDGIVYVDNSRGLVLLPPGAAPTAARVLLGLDKVRDPKWPQAVPNGRGFIFTRSTTANPRDFEIAAVSAPGAEPRTLVRGLVGFVPPTGSLVYVTADGDLMAATLDMGALRVVGAPGLIDRGLEIQFNAVDVSVSDRGTLVYGTRSVTHERSEIVLTERDGSTRALDANWRGDFQDIEFSPDGSKLAVTNIRQGQNLDVWIKPVRGGPATRLTIEGDRSFRATWHPDGQRVGFVVDRGDVRQFFVRRADGAGAAQLAFPLPVNQAHWSHDGKWLIYRTGVVGELDIFARGLGSDTTTITVAAQAGVNELSPTLSHDGKWIAYQSDRSGAYEVYVRPYPNAAAGEWQVSNGGGTEPRWSHSGRELFFKQNGQLMAAQIQASPAFAVGRTQALFSLEDYYNFPFHPTYDVAPGDQRFAMIRSRYFGELFDLVVVENWTAARADAR